MAALFSFAISVGTSLTSSLSDDSPLSCKLAGPALVKALARVVPILKVSPNNLSFTNDLGGSFCFTRFLSQRRLRTKLWNHG